MASIMRNWKNKLCGKQVSEVKLFINIKVLFVENKSKVIQFLMKEINKVGTHDISCLTSVTMIKTQVLCKTIEKK